MIKIAPSIFAGNFTQLGSEVKDIESAGADMLHIDIMDGNFVPNISLGPLVVSWLRPETSIVFDVHLMINEPGRFAPEFKKAGADIITFHLESDCNPHQLIKDLRKMGTKVGISIKPQTHAQELFPYLDAIDMVLVMTVEPGFSGQSFMDLRPKIRKVRQECIRRRIDMDIQVDGGISSRNADLITEAGANVIVAGSAIFSQPDYKTAIKEIRDHAEKGMHNE